MYILYKHIGRGFPNNRVYYSGFPENNSYVSMNANKSMATRFTKDQTKEFSPRINAKNWQMEKLDG